MFEYLNLHVLLNTLTASFLRIEDTDQIVSNRVVSKF